MEVSRVTSENLHRYRGTPCNFWSGVIGQVSFTAMSWLWRPVNFVFYSWSWVMSATLVYSSFLSWDQFFSSLFCFFVVWIQLAQFLNHRFWFAYLSNILPTVRFLLKIWLNASYFGGKGVDFYFRFWNLIYCRCVLQGTESFPDTS